jgi:hypothetical protein
MANLRWNLDSVKDLRIGQPHEGVVRDCWLNAWPETDEHLPSPVFGGAAVQERVVDDSPGNPLPMTNFLWKFQIGKASRKAAADRIPLKYNESLW